MLHYICKGGCKGISPEPGICQNPTCIQYKERLEPCTCTDNDHHGAFQDSDDAEDADEAL